MSPARKYLNEHWQAVGVLLAVFGLGFSGAWKPLRDEVHAQGTVLIDVDSFVPRDWKAPGIADTSTARQACSRSWETN